MSVKNEYTTGSETVVLERPESGGVYASLFEKINLNPVSELSALDIWQDAQAMSDATADERLTAGMQVFLECLSKAGSKVEKLDKNLIDHHIAELDYQISLQLDAVMHHDDFQAVESLWRGVKSLVDKTDFRQNVKIELLDLSKESLRQDFEDAPEIIQSGLYKHTYIDEYDTPGGEPIGALISAYEFDASAQDVALLRNISKVSAAAHMPFIGSAGPKFFLKDSMEEVAAIKDIGNYFDRAEYIKWKSFRETDDSRYIGLVMPRVLGRLPYGPDTVPVRSFNYVEEVKGPDHDKYLWTNASFAFASNMVRSFINNGWCVQIRGPQAGGAVQDLPIHLYDLGTGNQVKIPSEVMIPETREFEFANLGFIPLSYYKKRDYSCFFSANSTQKPALYDTADATANSRIRVATWYCWAKLHREGEQGLAEGLELLAGLLERFGTQLHPQRDRSRKAALEWLGGSRMTDSLSLYPEVVRENAERTTGALLLIAKLTANEPEETRPEFNALYGTLESRLQKAGGVDAVVPQNVSSEPQTTASHSDAPAIGRITSGQDLLAQARTLTEYLLRPKRLQDGHTEIYAVDSVTGSNRTSDAEYVPFSSFRHKGGMMRRHAPPRYYHTRVKRGVTGLYDTWLILGGHQWENDRLFEREAVSLQIIGTNGQLPRRALTSTLLDRCEQVVSTSLTVRNLCKPTLPVYPPAEDRFHWRVLSHLGSGFLNMMSTAEVLRGTLALYNWQEDELNTRRLEAIQQVLQRLELKHLSQLDTLRTLMHNSAVRLENSDDMTRTGQTIHSGSGLPAKVMRGAAASTEAHPGSLFEENTASDSTVKWVYVAQPEPQSKVEGMAAMPTPVKKWKSFVAGMCAMLVISIGAVWAWQYLSKPDPLQIQLAASLAPTPVTLSPAQLDVLRQQSPLPQTVIAQTQQQIARLDKLPPDWNIVRSRQLVYQVQALWPEQAKILTQQWQQQLNAVALPTEHLDGWHLGMTKLQQLSDRLNGLDEQKGKYMTVSVLKSVVFSAMQSFNQSMPAEEQLRVLSQTPEGQPLPSAAKAQAEMHLKQLIARYALVAQSDDAQRSLIQLKTTDDQKR